MTEKREPYEPYACMETGMAQLRALEMARHLEDCTINRQAILIRALVYLVGIQTVGLFLLAMFT